MGLEGQMREVSATGHGMTAPEFTAAMIAPCCDAGTGGPGSFVARDFDLEAVPPGSLLHLTA